MNEISPDTLPFPLSERIEPKNTTEVEIQFNRRLGHIEIIEPEPQKVVTVISGCASAYSDLAIDIAGCTTDYVSSKGVSDCYGVTVSELHNNRYCLTELTAPLVDINHCHSAKQGLFSHLDFCLPQRISGLADLRYCDDNIYSTSTLLNHCDAVDLFKASALRHCDTSLYVHTRNIHHCADAKVQPSSTGYCIREQTQRTVYVPCEYYPIPIEPPVKPDIRPCVRYPSHRLKIAFTRTRAHTDSAMLPLPFACTFTEEPPILKSYIMHNIVTATVNGLPLEILSASIQSDVSSFCWQGQVTLYPDDFIKIDMDNKDSPVIEIVINGHAFAFLAEDYSDNRSFGQKTYTVTGRSITAHLSKDYAKTHTGAIVSDLYARQIADQVLSNTGFKIKEWLIADWLVPANSYVMTDKTAIEILMDIAECAGGFVESDPITQELSLKPKWKAPAWYLHNTTPDMIIPDSVITNISGQKRISTRCNGIFISADHEQGKGGNVYRQGTDQEPRATMLTHSLYTDLQPIEAAGIKALSETGKHKVETVKTIIAEKYGMGIAKKGDVIQIKESSGHWKGVVESISIDVAIENNVPVVYQTISIDRYMDI